MGYAVGYKTAKAVLK